MYIDKHDYIQTQPAFNQQKFYCGRAVEIAGTDEDGEPVKGVFLIKWVEDRKMTLINSLGNEYHFHLSSFVDEKDDTDGEIYEKSIHIKLFGDDRS